MNHETIEKALEEFASAHTRRMYERALKRLAGWLNGRELSYTTAREYKAEMVQSGFSPQNINGQIAPHDLRRTFARLAYEGKAPLAQIQLALGHANQGTTENYVNAAQDLKMSPSDVLGLNPSI